MTDKPTPTDAELKAMWQLHAADIGGIFHYARAVLQRWGQPSGAGEAAEHYRNAIASACEGWTMPDGLRKHLETALWSLPPPCAGRGGAADGWADSGFIAVRKSDRRRDASDPYWMGCRPRHQRRKP